MARTDKRREVSRTTQDDVEYVTWEVDIKDVGTTQYTTPASPAEFAAMVGRLSQNGGGDALAGAYKRYLMGVDLSARNEARKEQRTRGKA